MWIIEVIPISRSFFKDTSALTYFSTKKLEPGALVEVGLRNKNSLAIVASIEKLEIKKASVKRRPFVLKKVSKILNEKFVSPKFIESLDFISDYFLTSRSSLLQFFLPKGVLKKSFYSKTGNPSLLPAKNNEFKTTFYQAERPERIKYYRGLIRETLSRGNSVAVLLPTISLAEDAFEDLKIGIEDRTFLLHGDFGAKNLATARNNIALSENPAVLVGTGAILPFLRPDTNVLIVDEESSEYYYNSRRRPFFDLRHAAEIIGKKLGLRLVFGDIVLRLDYGFKQDSVLHHGRILSSAENRIIDSAKKTADGFKVLSPELVDLVSEAQFKKESVVIVGHRRGFSPTTLCQDCGETVICPNCSSPLVIHQKNGGQKHFFCHYCLRG